MHCKMVFIFAFITVKLNKKTLKQDERSLAFKKRSLHRLGVQMYCIWNLHCIALRFNKFSSKKKNLQWNNTIGLHFL